MFFLNYNKFINPEDGALKVLIIFSRGDYLQAKNVLKYYVESYNLEAQYNDKHEFGVAHGEVEGIEIEIEMKYMLRVDRFKETADFLLVSKKCLDVPIEGLLLVEWGKEVLRRGSHFKKEGLFAMPRILIY